MSNVYRYIFLALLPLLLSVGAATAQAQGVYKKNETYTNRATSQGQFFKPGSSVRTDFGFVTNVVSGIVLQLVARQQNIN
jgi:hypothetical protein